MYCLEFGHNWNVFSIPKCKVNKEILKNTEMAKRIIRTNSCLQGRNEGSE